MQRPFLNVFLLLTLVGPRLAHSQSIFINDPIEWREGTAYNVVAGKPFRVAGTVTHPAGVAKVFINGREVAIRQDKDYPDYYDFEKIFSADSVPPEVTVRVMSVSGQPFEKRYTATLPVKADKVVAKSSDAVVKPPPPHPIPVNAWGPFKVRGILYGAAMIGGGVLVTMNKSESAVVCSSTPRGSDCVNRTTTSKPYAAAGAGLVGAAAFVTIVDALLTSRRANQSVASLAIPGGVRLSLEVPAVAPSPRGASVEVLRIGVH